VLYCTNYNYSLRLAGQVSEKGAGKQFAKPLDLPNRTACRYAGREGLLYWTMITVTGNYMYPEQTPSSREADSQRWTTPLRRFASVPNSFQSVWADPARLKRFKSTPSCWPSANIRAKFQIETWKVQEPVEALRLLPLDVRTGCSAEFQGFVRLLSASKWRCNTCTFCTHTESQP
jgi:hypothetical protein